MLVILYRPWSVEHFRREALGMECWHGSRGRASIRGMPRCDAETKATGRTLFSHALTYEEALVEEAYHRGIVAAADAYAHIGIFGRGGER